ncbi:nuclear transport factor 2 family protein [Chelativorans sp. SCAU2101]|uniref:Nuclear transport factor 2 family protein n=1 Tax=Chelativorans petroleitrophicus TaxID=2975484 RepID=A0A9X2XBK7_9HYPH|nr:nuclear transport factor 2 family protein [Chelativorans petroleitrophicus]MCT8992199.1 nuclear transport factor 2 family protein [Chelativorans petroleitrophicus]
MRTFKMLLAVATIAVAPYHAAADEVGQGNLKVIEDYYAAHAAGDLDAIRSYLAPDVVWRIPGHHPLAGEKRGRDEVMAFFGELAKGRFSAEPIFFQAQGDLVVDIHRGWSNVGEGPEIDQLYALMFRLRDGKIVEAQNFLTDMHSSDAFFWAHYPLKPLPDRLAE